MSMDNLDRLAEALRELDARIRVNDWDESLPFNRSAESLRGIRCSTFAPPQVTLPRPPVGRPACLDNNASVTQCDVPAVPVLHPALAGRFSPAQFDPAAEVSDGHVDTLLDAARLAPSAGNSQPWMFIIGRRGDPIHTRIVPHLAHSSSRWAPDASLLVVNLAQVYVEEDSEWEYSEFSRYDLGQAVAHMCVQGLAMGLACHQFRAFDRDAVAREFAVPTHWEVTSMTACGVAAHSAGDSRDPGISRARRSREDITWARA